MITLSLTNEEYGLLVSTLIATEAAEEYTSKEYERRGAHSISVYYLARAQEINRLHKKITAPTFNVKEEPFQQ